MGFFNRRPRDGPAAAPAANGHHRAAHDRNLPYSMASRPSFGQWLKHTWLDILTMGKFSPPFLSKQTCWAQHLTLRAAAMGAIGLGVYEARPAPTRSFAVTFADGEVVYPDFAFPLRKE